MSIRVLKAGVFDTIQDQGRTGHACWGVNTNGVMDMYAADVANALVANDASRAVVEMHFPAAEILFEEAVLFSLTGGDFSAFLNGLPVPSWKTVIASPGSVLSFKGRTRGNRIYLAVNGGFDVEEWLGSRSTNVKSGVGGFCGRRLLKEDKIEICPSLRLSLRSFHVFPWTVNPQRAYHDSAIALLKGNEFDWLSDDSKDAVTAMEFSIDSSSDRMATHLVHHPLTFKKKQELFSSAVTFGTIQLLPSGKLIVLMADHQTTGGYPRVGHVAGAFLPLFSQLSPGEKFRFYWTTLAEAEKMLFSLRTEMNVIRSAIRDKLQRHA